MASKKVLRDNLRAGYMAKVKAFLESLGEEVYITASNEIRFNCLDEERNEACLALTFKIPTGERETGFIEEPCDLARSYEMHLAELAEKAKVAEEKKAKKIAKDNARRAKEAAAKARREADTETAVGDE